VRQAMESMFGAGFAAVRIHVGPHPATIGAVAFTHGTNIHFSPGHYDPSTVQGRRVLAHELTHVVQQRAGRVRNPEGSGVALVSDRALEAEAERMSLRASSLRIAPAAPGPLPVQRKTQHGGAIQMWPRALTAMEARQFLNEQIDAYCHAHAATPFTADTLKDHEADEYKALMLRFRGDPAKPDSWMNEKAAKIYARNVVAEYAPKPRRLTLSEARTIINDDIKASVLRRFAHPSLIDSLRDFDAKDYKDMVTRLRGTDHQPEVWPNYKAAQIYGKTVKIADGYVGDHLVPSAMAWPRALSEDEATVVIHTAVGAELKRRTAMGEGYPKSEEARIQGKKGEALKEFKGLLISVRGPAGREVWRNSDDARRYLEVSGQIEEFVTAVLRIPSVPLTFATTLDSTSYSMRHLFCNAVRAKHNSVDDNNLRNALNRMEAYNAVHGNGDLTKMVVGTATKTDIGRLQGGQHASFGRGPGGCTFFFRRSGGTTHEILAIGYHVLNAENYEIVWAFNAALRGRWSF
jgi:hypothetical protein